MVYNFFLGVNDILRIWENAWILRSNTSLQAYRLDSLATLSFVATPNLRWTFITLPDIHTGCHAPVGLKLVDLGGCTCQARYVDNISLLAKCLLEKQYHGLFLRDRSRAFCHPTFQVFCHYETFNGQWTTPFFNLSYWIPRRVQFRPPWVSFFSFLVALQIFDIKNSWPLLGFSMTSLAWCSIHDPDFRYVQLSSSTGAQYQTNRNVV